jgi:hypothetical protein
MPFVFVAFLRTGTPRPVHRVSPGTVVFHDWRGERQNPGMGLVPAAVLMARVVSIPAPGAVVTLDCGSKVPQP